MTTKQSFMQAVLLTPKAPGGVPVISPFAGWDYYYLRKAISWKPEADVRGQLHEVEVPAGFVTDLASVPRRFWSFRSPTEDYTYAAIIHDYMYWMQDRARKTADQIFKIAMGEFHVAGLEVETMYLIIRMCGGRSWRSNAEIKAAGEKRFLKHFPDDPRISWEQWKSNPDVFVT